MNSQEDLDPNYLSYMLRMWRARDSNGRQVWCASLEEPGSHHTESFGDTEAMFTFLQGRLGNAAEVDRRPYQHNQNDEELAFCGAGVGTVVSRDRNFQGRCGHERFIISG